MLPPILYVVPLPGGHVLPLFTYGFARGIAVIAGLLIWRFGFKRHGIDPDHAYMAFLWVGTITLITASSFGLGRVVAQLQRGAAVWPTLVETLTNAGSSSLVALPVAFLAMLLYSRLYGIPALTSLDVVALSACLAIPIQRVGCSAAGCCYGAPTQLPWGVSYEFLLLPYPRGAPLGVTLHPTQLYETIATLALFGALLWVFSRRPTDGTVLWLFVGGYSLIRFVVDVLRDDPHPLGEWHGLWAVHLLYAAGMITAALALYRARHQGAPPASLAPPGSALR